MKYKLINHTAKGTVVEDIHSLGAGRNKGFDSSHYIILDGDFVVEEGGTSKPSSRLEYKDCNDCVHLNWQVDSLKRQVADLQAELNAEKRRWSVDLSFNPQTYGLKRKIWLC